MLDDAIAKALEQAQKTEVPEEGNQTTTETPEAPSNDNSTEPEKTEVAGQTESVPKEPEPKKAPVVWDGDISKLPDELKEQAKAVQRYTTRIQTEAAEARKKAQELEAKLAKQPEPVVATEATAPAWTQAEYEDALLDSTGTKMQALVDRRTASLIEKAEVRASRVLSQVQQKQSLVEWESKINDFRSAHPDFDTLHKSGILMPIFEKVVVAGKGTIEDAYTQAKAVSEFFKNQALEEAQGRVNQKKEASVSGKTPISKADIITATDRDDAFNKAFDNAWEKKRVRVKVTR